MHKYLFTPYILSMDALYITIRANIALVLHIVSQNEKSVSFFSVDTEIKTLVYKYI